MIGPGRAGHSFLGFRVVATGTLTSRVGFFGFKPNLKWEFSEKNIHWKNHRVPTDFEIRYRVDSAEL